VGDLKSRLGRLVPLGSGGGHAFVPPPLPPVPPLDLIGLLPLIGQADRALGRLDGASLMLPDLQLFIYMYVRKEAVLSSQIEGTQSTLDDLLAFETSDGGSKLEQFDDLTEVSNYVDAMTYGIERLKELPLSLRLIRELHERLLKSGRGAAKEPGEFRRLQNWIGGTSPATAIYVPPPVPEMHVSLDAFERFMNAPDVKLPPLVVAGLLHLQFETIHPFLDGNGRVGRLLITLYLCSTGLLRHPLLYLSLYFKQNRPQYYALLQEVRERGNWETWIEFFLAGVAETAEQAHQTALELVDLINRDRALIDQSGERSIAIRRVYNLLERMPFVTTSIIAKQTGLSRPTVHTAVDTLVSLGVLSEVTQKKRDRIYAYKAYLAVLRRRDEQMPPRT
jgi:Fic family protein